MKKIFFIHIPKTGGVSIERMLARATGSTVCPSYHEEAFLTEQQEEYGLYVGHLLYYLKAFIRPDFTFTMLRDPVERAMSAFEHLCRDTKHATHRRLGKMPDLMGSLRDPLTRVHLSNAMSLYLGLRPKFEQFPDRRTAIRHAWARRDDRAILESAKQAILELDFVGFTETIDFNQWQLHQVLGRGAPAGFCAVAENVNPRKPQASSYRERLSPTELDALQDANAEDIELYKFARAVAERRGWTGDPASWDGSGAHGVRGSVRSKPARLTIELDEGLDGEGWHPVERRGEAHWRFTGLADVATVYLPDLAAAPQTLIVQAVHWVSPNHFRCLRARWNGVDLGAGQIDGKCVSFRIPADAPRSTRTRVDFLTPPAQIPVSGDNRRIGVAVSTIAVAYAKAGLPK